MKSKLRVLAIMAVFSALTIFSTSAQRNTDYAYHNSNSNDNRYPNSTTYDNSRGSNYSTTNVHNNNRDDRYKRRAYYTASPDLQRLYKMEDALLRRIDADIALGDRRELRRDQDKLEDVQRHIMKEEKRYASNFKRYDDRRSDYYRRH